MSSVGDKAFCEGSRYEIDDERKHFVTGQSDIPTPLADKIGIPLVSARSLHSRSGARWEKSTPGATMPPRSTHPIKPRILAPFW
jgi:hypothetical protein